MRERLWWWVRRIKLKQNLGLSSHWSSLVSSDCVLEGSNYVGKNVMCMASTLGRFSYINNESKVLMTDVGRYSCIGPECLIGGLGAHPVDRISTHRMFYSKDFPEWDLYCFAENFVEKKRTRIGHDVWIGARAIVMDGVTVGNGAVIAAGSIVTRDVAPYQIVAGVPAKIIRHRFSPEVVDAFLAEAWWNSDLVALQAKAKSGDFSKSLDVR